MWVSDLVWFGLWVVALGGSDFIYYDLDRGVRSRDIGLLFDDWMGGDERVAVLSPHDDDALLGVGYLISALIQEGCETYVIIYCDGRGGYSTLEEKDTIVSKRRVESRNAYRRLGIEEENIIRFEYPDFSLRSYIGWLLPNNMEGTMPKTLKTLRKIKPTRMIIPNEYREHIDHEALSIIGSYDGPQVGDAVLVEWGKPHRVRSYLKYSVWGDFSPEDALVKGRKTALRGNVAVKAKPEVEGRIIRSLKEFKSQERIIDQLVEIRSERFTGDGYIEVYLKFNPRPRIDYTEYKRRISEIDRKSS